MLNKQMITNGTAHVGRRAISVNVFVGAKITPVILLIALLSGWAAGSGRGKVDM
jgi:hypothetical protein